MVKLLSRNFEKMNQLDQPIDSLLGFTRGEWITATTLSLSPCARDS